MLQISSHCIYALKPYCMHARRCSARARQGGGQGDSVEDTWRIRREPCDDPSSTAPVVRMQGILQQWRLTGWKYCRMDVSKERKSCSSMYSRRSTTACGASTRQGSGTLYCRGTGSLSALSRCRLNLSCTPIYQAQLQIDRVKTGHDYAVLERSPFAHNPLLCPRNCPR